MSRLWRYLVIAPVLLSSLAVAQTASEDKCKDILVGGVRDTISNLDVAHTSQSTKEWFCSARFDKRSSSSSSSTQVTIPIYGKMAKYGSNGSDASASEARANFCRDSTAKFTNDDTSFIHRQIASPLIVTTWSDCMKRRSSGNNLIEFGAASVDAQTFILTAKFNPSLSGQTPPKIDGLSTPGATCGKIRLVTGASVPVQTVRERCTRVGRGPIVAILHTNYGDFEASLPRYSEGLSAGKVSVAYRFGVVKWAPGALRTDQKETGDHNCSRNCRKEPTRTNYQLTLTASTNERFVDPVALNCIGGPCGGWNEVKLVRHDAESAIASWDVWTRPTVWELSVATEVATRVFETRRSTPTAINFGQAFTVTVPAGASEATLEITGVGGQTVIPLNGTSNANVEVLSRTTTDGNTAYQLRLLDPQA